MGCIYSINDVHGDIIEIQTHLAGGLPTLQIIGMASKSIDESKERVRSALASSDLPLPRKKITCNMSPADIPKNGAHYDVAIALSILQEAKIMRELPEPATIVIGELSLDGKIKPSRGIIGKIQEARTKGYKHFIIPADNVQQASLLPDVYLYGTSTIRSLVEDINSSSIAFTYTDAGHFDPRSKNQKAAPDILEVVGQDAAKRALIIAAAGHHNILLNGPPGVGKSMLAKTMIGIMPELSREEAITITQIHSLVGSSSSELVFERPLRSPHHSTSDVALIGGGTKPKPGEVSLSHGGVLFLDELPEFKRSALESLRQPLEDRVVTVSRAQDRITYPADFILVATKNPCPCGFWGSSRPCTCAPLELERYRKKLSGPLLDRIDIHVTVDAIDHKTLLSLEQRQPGQRLSSQQARQKVAQAVSVQRARFKQGGRYNASMTNAEIRKHLHLQKDAKELLDSAAEKLGISARVYMKIVKIARTIADLEASPDVTRTHISEALRYRPVPTS